ncbi:MAG: hypothetical protein U0R80_00290 [Nocardioidaceae bacterium]
MGAVLATVLMATSVDAVAPARGAESSTRSAARQDSFTVVPTMRMNDPTHHRGQVARLLRTYVAHTPRGATISILSFYLSSSITWPALRAAYERGVDIRVILFGGPDGQPMTSLSPEGVKLQAMIDEGRAHGRRGSWVVWTRRTARGVDSGNTVMHAKLWQFSRVGRTEKVTVIGSYNNGDPPDARAYSAMVTLTDPKLYRHTQAMFLESAKDRRDGKNPQRRFTGDGWDLYFFPSTPITAANDPVMDRLRAIPGNADTQMTVSMYSMQGRRGAWLARRLATMVEGGAQLTLVVGPDVEASVQRTLRAAGATLEDGCWRTGNRRNPYAYTHDKEMTATWVEDGVRKYGAWLGSDDWGNGPGGSQSDQATVGLFSEWAFTKLTKLLAPQIAHEPDNLARCRPLGAKTGWVDPG